MKRKWNLNTPLRIARHEAAHAVCAVKLGIHVAAVGIGAHPKMRGSAGWTKLRRQKRPDPLECAHVYLAGDAAEWVFYRIARRERSPDDWNKAREFGFRDRSLNTIAFSAEEFVKEHAETIERVARALVKRRELSRRTLLALCRQGGAS